MLLRLHIGLCTLLFLTDVSGKVLCGAIMLLLLMFWKLYLLQDFLFHVLDMFDKLGHHVRCRPVVTGHWSSLPQLCRKDCRPLTKNQYQELGA